MTDPDRSDQSKIDGCAHQFCFDCIKQWSDRENTCPLCKTRFSNIERLHPVKGLCRTQKVANRSQRMVAPHQLELMLARFAELNSFPFFSMVRLNDSGNSLHNPIDLAEDDDDDDQSIQAFGLLE